MSAQLSQAILPTQVIRTEWPPNDGVMPGDPQFDALLESIRIEGRVLVPLTLNLGLYVIDGNHRLSAARHLGITHVPVRFWTGVEFIS